MCFVYTPSERGSTTSTLNKRPCLLQLRNQENEISELREQTVHLEEKVENLSLQNTSSVFQHSANSLFNELSMSQHMSQSTDSIDMAHQPTHHQPVSALSFLHFLGQARQQAAMLSSSFVIAEDPPTTPMLTCDHMMGGGLAFMMTLRTC